MTTTYTGRLLTTTNFGVPSHLDIAVQLGRLPRFAGATRRYPWSVLHHVCACYAFAENNGVSFEGKAVILLHDAEECATGDVPTTWKNDALRSAQHRLSDRLFNSMRGPTLLSASDIEFGKVECKKVDMLMLVAEMYEVGPPNVLEHSGCDAMFPRNSARLAEARETVNLIASEYAHPYDSAIRDGKLVRWFLARLQSFGFADAPHATPKEEDD